MKAVKEIAVVLENKPGALYAIDELLSANGINILALTVRTEGEKGNLSLIVTDPGRAEKIFESAGFALVVKEVLAAEIPHHPGALHALLKPLKLAGVNLEYIYPCIAPHGQGEKRVVLLGVDNIEAAYEALSKEWIPLFGEELCEFC